jgi:rsbT antagonist protein RsbS
MPIPILKLSSVLIVTMQEASDGDLSQLKSDLADKVGRFRSHGVVIDVSAVDVMDSFATRTLEGIAHATRLRGAETVVVGIQPDVAFAMIQLGLSLDDVATALDLEEGMALLAAQKVKGAAGAIHGR